MYEANHGLIRVCKNYKAAINYLLAYGWLNADVEVFSEQTSWDGKIIERQWSTIEEALGENWEKQLFDWNEEIFNEFFDGSFFMDWQEVWE